jgi:hypothetical protein
MIHDRDIAGYELKENPQRTSFFLERIVPGEAVTVTVRVWDSCGPWDTLVGGGPGAF